MGKQFFFENCVIGESEDFDSSVFQNIKQGHLGSCRVVVNGDTVVVNVIMIGLSEKASHWRGVQESFRKADPKLDHK